MQEVIKASQQGRLLEMFGSGTAAIVSPIKKIRYIEQRDPQGNASKFTVTS
jgi:branched-chain amino acid aminotransferase